MKTIAYILAFLVSISVRAEDLNLCVDPSSALKIKFNEVPWLQLKPNATNLEITMPGLYNDRYIYMGAAYAINLTDPGGGIVEVAGNAVTPVSSRGAVYLHTGDVPTGNIGLVVSNSEGRILAQNGEHVTRWDYLPHYNTLRLYFDQFIQAAGTVQRVLTLGNKVKIAIQTGRDGRMGVEWLSSGSVTIPNSTVTWNTQVFISRKSLDGPPGHLTWEIDPGVGFSVFSTEPADSGSFTWLLVEGV